ncbi:MAG: hypothetical protein HY841_09320 [Bacteroidetes bacterium]|nr:hypothetical protein [Bacteroidota bacterium]
MKRIKVWMIIGLILSVEGIRCQDFNYSDSLLKRKNIIHLLGYSRVLERFRQPVILTTDIPLGIGIDINQGIQLEQTGLSAGGHILIRNKNKFKTAVKSHLTMVGMYSESFTIYDLSFRTEVLSGWYSPHWFLAVAINTTLPIVRNFSFASETYRNLYNPPSGWYHPEGVGFGYGAIIGYTIKQRSDIILRFDKGFYNYGYYLSLDNFSIQINYRF